MDQIVADRRAQGEALRRLEAEITALDWLLEIVEVLKARGELAGVDLEVRSRLVDNTRERVEG